jgi:hypothetical protein
MTIQQPAFAPDDDVVDLTDPVFLDALMRERHARRFDEAHIVEWLRSSGGPLADRIMKHLAADAIERSWTPR